MRSLIVLLSLIMSLSMGCLGTETSVCGERICSASTVCAPAFGSCFAPDLISSCDGVADGAECMTALTTGICDRGVCFAANCGDGVINDDEVCDDGNRDDGDGCSAQCDSNESCGNGMVDAVNGEECDCGDGRGDFVAGCNGINSETPGASCTSSCVAHCGDGEINSAEQCEPETLLSDTCVDLGFDLGSIECGQLCQLDFASCLYTGWKPSQFFDNPATTRDLVVVSDNLAYAADGKRVLKYDGTGWSTTYQAEADVTHVWATSENDVWVSTEDCFSFGGFGGCSVAIYNDPGTGWVERSASGQRVTDIWGTGPSDVYFAQNGGVRHWDGKQWNGEIGLDPQTQYSALWGSASGEIWLVGQRGAVLRKYEGTWAAVVGPFSTNRMYSIWGQGDNIAIGSLGKVFHRDGAEWSETQLPTTAAITSLWSGSQGLFASDGTGVFHFDGSNWFAMSAQCSGPMHGVDTPWMACGGAILIYQGSGWGSTPNYSNIHFSARARDDIYAIQAASNYLFHFDGIAWSGALLAGAPRFVVTTNNSVYVAGATGFIFSPGAEVSLLRISNNASIEAFWANDAGLLVVPESVEGTLIVNEYRISWRPPGGTWQPPIAFGARVIRWSAAHGSGDSVIVLGNEDGTGIIVRFDGAASAIELEVENELTDVWVQDQDNAVVVGNGGLVLFYENGVWAEQEFPAVQNFLSVGGTSMSDLFAITEFNEIWHYDGNLWTELRGLDADRRSVQVLPDSVLFSTDSRIDAWIR